jgi:hypothetical protein
MLLHGTACSPHGANVCTGFFAWNGRELALQGKARLATQAEINQLSAEGSDTSVPFAARWQLGTHPTIGPVAYLTGHPQLPTVIVRCLEGAPAIQLNLGNTIAGRPIPLPAEEVTLGIHLSGNNEASEDHTIDADKILYLSPAAGPREFGVKLTPQMVERFAGSASNLEASISVNGGASWYPAESLPLDGSTAAIRSVASACSAESISGGQKPIAPLGIVAGHYVSETLDCSRPEGSVFYYDGKRIGLMSDQRSESIMQPVGRVRAGRGTLTLSDWDMDIKVLSPTRIQRTIQDTGAPERWCPASTIPASYRGDR